MAEELPISNDRCNPPGCYWRQRYRYFNFHGHYHSLTTTPTICRKHCNQQQQNRYPPQLYANASHSPCFHSQTPRLRPSETAARRIPASGLRPSILTGPPSLAGGRPAIERVSTKDKRSRTVYSPPKRDIRGYRARRTERIAENPPISNDRCNPPGCYWRQRYFSYKDLVSFANNSSGLS